VVLRIVSVHGKTTFRSPLTFQICWTKSFGSKRNNQLAQAIGQAGRQLALSMTFEREVERGVHTIASCFRYFSGCPEPVGPFWSPVTLLDCCHPLQLSESMKVSFSAKPATPSIFISPKGGGWLYLVVQFRYFRRTLNNNHESLSIHDPSSRLKRFPPDLNRGFPKG